MVKPVVKKNVGLLRSVEERALSKKLEDEQNRQQVPYLDKDCTSNILIRLPIESLPKSRFVCKPWYNIIRSPHFIDAHLRHSESVMIFLNCSSSTSMPPRQLKNAFSVEYNLLQTQPPPFSGQSSRNNTSKFYIHFMEFKEGKSKVEDYNVSCLGNIRATCNGLILLDNKLKSGGLIVMNPVTRKLSALPLGTLYPHAESYGFALNDVTREYKVVHLFRDKLGYISCEKLCLGNRSWREVNGPSFGLFGWLGHRAISAIGALHWLPQIDHSDYIVSMEVENDKFHTIRLPKSCGTHDRIIKMGGFLCFVTHEDLNIDIWNLKSVFVGIWTKQYSITKGCIIDMVPLFSLRISGDLIFRRNEGGSFYAYNFQFQVMRKVEMDMKHFPLYDSYLPHVNSLISWTTS